MKTVMAFMAEPVTNLNMLYIAAVKARHGDVKFLTKAVGTYAVSVAFNAALKALVSAGRDDDEEKSYLEKYLAAFVSSVVEEPFGMIPYLKDVISIVKGFDSKRMDTQVIANFVNAVRVVLDEDKSFYEKLKSVVGAAGSLIGFPAKNIWRDVEMIYNGITNIVNGNTAETTTMGIEYAIREALGIEASKEMQYYDAVMSGDTAHADRIYASFRDEETGEYDQQKADNAVVRALKKYDPRVLEAAQAQIDGDSETRIRLTKEIIADGFEQNHVVKAVNSMINKLTDEDEEYDQREQSLYTKDDYFDAAYRGDESEANTYKEALIRVDMENTGKTRAEAEKSFNSSFRSSVKDAVIAGDITVDEAAEMLEDFGGLDEDTARMNAQYYDFIGDNPDLDYIWNAETVADYYEYAKPSGIRAPVYDDYLVRKSESEGTDNNNDGKTDNGSKKAQILDVIDSLPISSRQKDVLYRMNGWAESKLYEAPWH